MTFEHSKIFIEIHVEYVFYGEDINPEDVQRAIDLSSTKYCSIAVMLSTSAKITHSYRVKPPVKYLE